MKLVHRVSAFFLTALGLSLLGNALLIVVFARHFLYEKFEQQLSAALHTLVAAVEVEDDDVKWEPSDHTISLGSEDGLDDVRWIVTGENNQVIDHSRNLSPPDESESSLLWQREQIDTAFHESKGEGPPWRRSGQVLAAPHPKPVSERDPKEFAQIHVLVARSTADVDGSLMQLAVLVGTLSIAVWLVAAVLGQWYCRKALRPVTEMAAQARTVTTADFQVRLHVSPQDDELSDLSQAFNALLNQLQQAFEKQRRFTGDAAHELRTPLTVLLGQIDVALRRPRPPEEYQNTLSLLRTQTLELQQIVEALLFLARAEGDAALPGVETRSVREWISDYLVRWDAHPRRHDLSAVSALSTPVTTSWPLIAQLTDNLVGNAMKFSAPGTPIVIELRSASGEFQLTVTDSGTGIDPTELGSIFEPFIRSKQARMSGVAGTGLGLAISAGIAKALKGRLDCQSQPGKGSTFRLAIPVET